MRHLRNGVLAVCLLSLMSGCAQLRKPPYLLKRRPATVTQPAVTQTALTAPPADTTGLIEPPAWLFNDIACAPTLTTQAPPTLRLIGSQDPIIKHMMGPGDTIIINGGSAAGLQPGQRFFVRRNVKTFGARGPDATHPVSVHTAGWIQILGVDAVVATASVLHACEGMLLDDYLEPYVAPMIAARSVPGTLPQYSNMGHITTGDETTQTAGIGQMMGIDRGSKSGVVLGQRFLVFRDKRSMRNEGADYSETFNMDKRNLPLVEVGEVIAVAVRPDDATVQVTMSKDAVTLGDLIAQIR